jgi:glycosyltransferase involved in cell wall biosynthesis
MNLRRVSVVIPCFNHARFLGEAIESALAQTRTDVEVVVIDDGSTDESADVASRYPVRLIRQANHGLARARNAGLRASCGDVLIFLDADDRLHPEAAARACTALDRSPAAMMAFGRCRLIDQNGAPLATNLPPVTGHFYEELLRRNYIWTPAMAAYRRPVFDAVGLFDPRSNPAADYDMYLRVAKRFGVVAHDAVVADYRQHAASMSRDPVLMLDSTLAVLRRHRRSARRTAAERRAWQSGMRHWREWYGEHLVERFRAALRTPGGWREALRCAFHLLRLYPRGVVYHLGRKTAVAIRRARSAAASLRITHTSHSPSR